MEALKNSRNGMFVPFRLFVLYALKQTELLYGTDTAPGFFAHDILRKLVCKGRGSGRTSQNQFVARPRHAHIEQAALFGLIGRMTGRFQGKKTGRQAGHKDSRKLETLGAVQGHEAYSA